MSSDPSQSLNEDALRALVRDTIARLDSQSSPEQQPHVLRLGSDASHYRYALPPSDGPCLIEPGVRCNHCGYCESHGH
jgi:hypothetical protein